VARRAARIDQLLPKIGLVWSRYHSNAACSAAWRIV
jgi:hypothetical protein